MSELRWQVQDSNLEEIGEYWSRRVDNSAACSPAKESAQ